MARLFTDEKLVLASHNAGKVREIAALLAAYKIEVLNAGDLGLPEPIEDGDSFIANATIKAREIAAASNLPALADDSGLCVDVLGGAPGIFSARWAGPDKNFDMAMEKLKEATADFEEVKAHFTCSLALCWPAGHPDNLDAGDHVEVFEGYVHGKLSWPARGENGFGYDPIFIPHKHHMTFGEMHPSEKQSMTHRADAFKKLVAACFTK